MRNLVLAALFLTMPFSGMRVICVGTSTLSETGSDCERLCARHHVSATSGTSNCALSTDGTSLLVFASTAAVEPEQPVGVTSVMSAVAAESRRCRPEPELARQVPPPKPQILL